MPEVSITHYGQYYLTRGVATGGMAELFRARKLGAAGFEKLLAIKRLLPHLARSQELVAMFLDEARLASLLSHQNIAQVYDLGCLRDQGGQDGATYYLAMEYVFGKNLAEILRAGQQAGVALSTENLVKVVLGVAVALAYANAKRDHAGNPLGIVHRDVSPANILVSYEGEIKLTDFGIAKALSQSSVTQPGVLKGKFAYMSPEQAKGQPLDTRTDIYSLGIVLWEGLTGQRLFSGPSEAAILHAVSQGQVPEPSSLGAGVPPELEDICLKCLARQPEDRYPSAEHLARDLEDCLRGLSAYSGAYSLRAHMHRLFGQAMAQELEQIRAEDEALRRLGLGEASEALPATVLWPAPSEPAQTPPEAMPSPAPPEPAPPAQTPRPAAGPQAPPGPPAGARLDPLIDAPALAELAGEPRRAPSRKGLVAGGTVLAVLLLALLTWLAWRPQEPSQELTAKPGQVSHLPQAYRPRPPGALLPGAPAPAGEDQPGQEAQAPPPTPEAPDDEGQAPPATTSQASSQEVLSQQVRNMLNARQYEQALAMIRGLEASQPQAGGQLGPEKSAALVGVALIGLDSNPAQALPLLREAIQADPSNAVAYLHLGRAQDQLGRPNEALDAFSQAAALAPKLAEAHLHLGLSLLRQDRLPQALRAFQQVVDLGGDLVDQAYADQGICLARLGEREQAVAMFRQSLAHNPSNDEARRGLSQLGQLAGQEP